MKASFHSLQSVFVRDIVIPSLLPDACRESSENGLMAGPDEYSMTKSRILYRLKYVGFYHTGSI